MSKSKGFFLLISAITLLLAVILGVAQVNYVIITLPDPGVGGALDGGGTYPAGASVSLIAHPSLGYRFVGWSENGESLSTDPTLEFTADHDRELVARFDPIPLETGISGRWDVALHILPNIALQSSRLEFNYSQANAVFSGDLRLTATFASTGWTGFDARTNIKLGGWQASAGLTFNPTSASYKSSYFSTNWKLFDIYWSLRVNHQAIGGGTSGPYMLYALSARTDNLVITARAEQTDCCLSFRDVLVNMSSCNFSFCDEIPLSASLSLTKDDGFSYLQLSARNVVELCCGISFDARLKFTSTAKELSITPHWAGWGDTSFKLYGNTIWDDSAFALGGLDLYGFKIRCCLECGSCPGSRVSAPYVEFLTGFDLARVPGGFRGDEFEYWKAGFCGPACCGGYYTVETTAYFSHSIVSLFSLSRLKIYYTLPLFEGFMSNLSLEMDIASGAPTLDLGWKWAF